MPSGEPVTKVTIKDDGGPGLEKYENVLLELTGSGKDLKFALVASRRDEEIISAYLDECTYVEESSIPGIDCFNWTKKRKIVTIFHKDVEAGKLLDEMRRFCRNLPSPTRREPPTTSRARSRSRTPPRRRSPSRSPPRSSRPPQRDLTETINEFIRALNQQDQNRAQRAAEDLAHDRANVRFALDLTNEGGNKAAPQATPAPPRQKFDLKLTVESFLVDQCNDQQYDVSILSGTKISDLKGMVQQQTGIASAQQFWFIDRDHLPDNYEFGASKPTVTGNSVLTLFITKPKNN